MKQQLGKLFVEFRGIWRNAVYRPHMQKEIQSTSEVYTQYLDGQLKRTLQKNDNRLKDRTVHFIEKLNQLADVPNATVLTVGCRNHTELDHFIRKGVKQVTGIDLYSTDDDILVMDMHNMTFADDEFDIVYSSHSLEHAYDVEKVAGEFVRVCKPDGIIAIEMPINFEPRGADLIDIGDIDTLSALFSPHIKTILWHEQHTGKTGQGAITAIFRINKVVTEQ